MGVPAQGSAALLQVAQGFMTPTRARGGAYTTQGQGNASSRLPEAGLSYVKAGSYFHAAEAPSNRNYVSGSTYRRETYPAQGPDSAYYQNQLESNDESPEMLYGYDAYQYKTANAITSPSNSTHDSTMSNATMQSRRLR